jgi:hypothetical protein
MLKRGDSICIEKKDDFSIIGFFQSQDDENILIEGTVGENTGKEIIVPKANVAQIIVIRRRERSLGRSLTEQERKDW